MKSLRPLKYVMPRQLVDESADLAPTDAAVQSLIDFI